MNKMLRMYDDDYVMHIFPTTPVATPTKPSCYGDLPTAANTFHKWLNDKDCDWSLSNLANVVYTHQDKVIFSITYMYVCGWKLLINVLRRHSMQVTKKNYCSHLDMCSEFMGHKIFRQL